MSKPSSTTTTSKVELPPEIEKAAKENIDIANEVASIGYTPYSGPTVAGLSPQQLSAMQSADQAMSAFGMPSAVNWQQQGGGFASPQGMSSDAMYQALTGMAGPNASAGGFSGYSGMDLMNQGIANMAPAQRAAIESFVMNPITGAAPKSASVPAPKTILDVPVDYARTPEEAAAIRKRNAANATKRADAAKAANKSKSSPKRANSVSGFGGKFNSYLGRN